MSLFAGAAPAATTDTTTQTATDTTVAQTQATAQTTTAAVKPAASTSQDFGPMVTDIHAFLRDLTAQAQAKETQAAQQRAADERAAIETKIRDQASAGDWAKVRESLGQLDGYFKGQLGEKDKQIDGITKQLHQTLLSNSLHQATAGASARWVNATAGEHAQERLAAKFEVIGGSDGGLKVVERGTGRPINDAVVALLATQEFAHYQVPTAQGRGGIGNGSQAAASVQTNGESLTGAAWLNQQLAIRQQQAQAQGLPVNQGLAYRKV